MRRKIISILIITHLAFGPVVSQARVFNPDNILSDGELLDKNSLSKTAIQVFLSDKNSVLAKFTQLVNGSLRKASEIIWIVAQEYGISPKFLLAKLQKEQGLLEKEEASQKALDWAMGYSCYNSGCNDKYKGFYNQVDAAAGTQLIYSQSPERFKFRVSKTTKTNDGYEVTPENQATANLYIYTPYRGGEDGIGGNYFFSRIWDRYFTSRKFPDGLTVKDESGNYFLIEKGKKRQFDNEQVYLTRYTPSDYFFVNSDNLNYYSDAAPITTESLTTEERFIDLATSSPDFVKDGLLFKDFQGSIFLTSSGERHRILNLSTASKIFGIDKISGAQLLDEKRISLLKPGDPIEYIDDSVKDIGDEIKLFLAVFDKVSLPSSWKVGEERKGELSFRNVGALSWKKGEVWLTLKSTGQRIGLSKDVVTGDTAEFNLEFPKSNEPKLVDEFFFLENKDGPIPGALIIKTYEIKSDEQANIVDENFPDAASNLSKPVGVELKVKNTGNITWNPRRTAFEIKNKGTTRYGVKSVFYDKKDWVRTNVAATPVERGLIKPGQVATFKFTLDARGIEPGRYPQEIRIRLTDKNRVLWLDYARPYIMDISITGKSYKKAIKWTKR